MGCFPQLGSPISLSHQHQIAKVPFTRVQAHFCTDKNIKCTLPPCVYNGPEEPDAGIFERLRVQVWDLKKEDPKFAHLVVQKFVQSHRSRVNARWNRARFCPCKTFCPDPCKQGLSLAGYLEVVQVVGKHRCPGCGRSFAYKFWEPFVRAGCRMWTTAAQSPKEEYDRLHARVLLHTAIPGQTE